LRAAPHLAARGGGRRRCRPHGGESPGRPPPWPAASLAGGQGKDADQLDDKERARLRRQALGWLRADLAAWTQVVDKAPPQARPAVRQALQHWQKDPDLAGLRDPDALAQLPEAERQACRKLWADVEALLRKARD
jgi:hypothetical protein